MQSPPSSNPPSPTPPPSGGYQTRAPQPKLAKVPKDTKEAAQEAFLDTILNAKSLAVEMIQDFRASDRFFKYKAAVIAAWALLSVSTLFIACPSAKNAPTNPLEARVRVQKVAALERQITALYIENRGEKEWGDLMVKLNNTYSAAIPGIPPGRNAVIELGKFSALDGKTPPPDLRPQRVYLLSSKCGDATFDLLESPSGKQ